MTAITTEELQAAHDDMKASIKGMDRDRKRELADKLVDMAWDAEEGVKTARFGEAAFWFNEAARRWAQASACVARNTMDHMEYTDAAARCRQNAEYVVGIFAR